jgi:hypothetical protein
VASGDAPAQSAASIDSGAWGAVVRALAPLDRARAFALRLVAPVARPLYRDRSLRVIVLAVVSIAFAFAMTLGAPLVLLAVGPIVLGVPHLLSDARYLVARRGLHLRAAFWIAIAAPATLVWTENRVYVGLIACAGAAVVARAAVAKKAVAVVALAAGAAVAYRFRGTAEIVFAHLHNLIALAIWAAFFRPKDSSGRGRALGAGHAAAAVIALFIALSVALFVVPVVPVADASLFGVSIAEQMRAVSPVAASSPLALRFVTFFAFAQTVHYAVWLRLVPEDDRPRAGVRSFASTARALRADLGVPVLVAFVGLSALFIAWACVSLHAARIGYLQLAVTHGYLEVAVAILFVLEAGRSRAD